MIKLNNKNITYVALADSNNSLKAPKEIWYADSNNSVKLVYRRKDALIEGEDYEKYHWLTSYDNSYINTNITDLSNISQLVCIYKASPNNGNRLFGREGVNNFGANRLTASHNGNFFSIWGYGRSNEILFSSLDDVRHVLIINIDDKQLDYDGILRNFECKNGDELNFLVYADKTSTGAVASQSGISMSNFKLSNKINLIPCKLLKPVPKWLDANGIRRQAGECGMIDLISGKFYGNVNSVGTFTVENYYERKEWLVGDGSAYIDTLIGDLTDVDFIKCNYSCTGAMVDNRMFGREGALIASAIRSDGLWVWTNPNYSFTLNHIKENDYIEINLKNRIASTSLQSYSFEPITNLIGTTIYLFGDHNFNVIFPYKIKKFYIDGKLNLIPCTLTMDLPASMDANNIARTKGTSGMWDLVSDRFYGNVANSGTFKAVNLAEGVDYEVHQWLKGDGTAYLYLGEVQNYIEFDANIPQADIQFRFVYGNNGALRVNGAYQVFGPLVDANRIKTYNTPLQSKIKIDLDTHLAYSNGEAFAHTNLGTDTNGESAFKSAYFFGNPSSTTSVFRGKCAIGNVDMDGNVFIPVKLLKSIPSKYDANGIARNAGECGMYDTVNDVFYGNVASSGTFSVSD